MTDRGPALAICGSNLDGSRPFALALRLAGDIHRAVPTAGERLDLAETAAALCRAHGLGPADLRELRLDLGPGSYTGLRVAVTFVRFLQRFGELPVLATDSLSLLAAALLPAPTAGRWHTVLDARAEHAHHATFVHDRGGLRVVHAPRAMPWADLPALLQAGDQVRTTPAVLAARGERLAATGAGIAPFGPVDPALLFAPWLPLAAAASADLEPRYLMGSYAERGPAARS